MQRWWRWYRLAPSASNKQPWRLLRVGDCWHFYLQRTAGYGQGGLAGLVVHGDLQRVDMGIAMCHFALAAHQLGLAGEWVVQKPGNGLEAVPWEYVVSWKMTGM